MTAIYLIRHGQASFGKAEYDCLSELGKQQATHLGENLKIRLGSFDKIVTGTMQRHQQTADGCLAAMGQQVNIVQQDARWNEYDHQDILVRFNAELATAQDVKAFVSRQDNPQLALETLLNQAFSRWIGGLHNNDYVESWPDYQSRIHTALAELVKNLKGEEKRVAVFSSGGPIALISQALLGVPAENLMALNWTLVNCGVTKLISSKKGLIVSTLNEHSVFEGSSKHLLTYK